MRANRQTETTIVHLVFLAKASEPCTVKEIAQGGCQNSVRAALERWRFDGFCRSEKGERRAKLWTITERGLSELESRGLWPLPAEQEEHNPRS